jgi:hypothetical protein
MNNTAADSASPEKQEAMEIHIDENFWEEGGQKGIKGDGNSVKRVLSDTMTCLFKV